MKFISAVLCAVASLGSYAAAQENGIPAIARHPPLTARFADTEVAAGTGLPTWRGKFTYQDRTYYYTMVGTDPSQEPKTTIIPVFIIPLRFTFSDGEVFDATTDMIGRRLSATEAVIESPIFQRAPFAAGTVDVGNTQYIDAFQRANFWRSGAYHADYHVLLGNPTVLPVQSFKIPKGFGFTFNGPVSGTKRAIVAQGFIDHNITPVIFQRFPQITPSSFPIFLTYNVFPGGNYGYHDVFGNSPATGIPYTYVSYLEPYQDLIDADISTLAHEVAEWMDDPYLSNFTPCGILEVGDPLSSAIFDVNLNGKVWHPQDLAMMGYFFDDPSPSVHGWLTFKNLLHQPCENGS